jgi:hypothetical protein
MQSRKGNMQKYVYVRKYAKYTERYAEFVAAYNFIAICENSSSEICRIYMKYFFWILLCIFCILNSILEHIILHIPDNMQSKKRNLNLQKYAEKYTDYARKSAKYTERNAEFVAAYYYTLYFRIYIAICNADLHIAICEICRIYTKYFFPNFLFVYFAYHD